MIELIGQPRLLDWALTALVRCSCNHPVLVTGFMGQCPECKMLIRIDQGQFKGGQLHANIATARPQGD